LPQRPLAPELLGLVQHVAAYERLAAAAATSGDLAIAKLALLANPLVREYELAGELLAELSLASPTAGAGMTR
jgi:6-phospho-beta-glucosidase